MPVLPAGIAAQSRSVSAAGMARGERLVFLAGLLGAGVVASWFGAAAVSHPRPLLVLVAAGLLVGFGTRVGQGCTSGHGVCGISRFSPRSFVATAVFMAAGALTVWLLGAGGRP